MHTGISTPLHPLPFPLTNNLPAPVLELGKILTAHSHAVKLAALEGQGFWTKDYPCILHTHLIVPGPSE